jgi:hypothetical protein
VRNWEILRFVRNSEKNLDLSSFSRVHHFPSFLPSFLFVVVAVCVGELCCVAEMQRRLFPREEDEDEGKLPRKPTTTTTTTTSTLGLFFGFEVLCRRGSRSRRRRRREKKERGPPGGGRRGSVNSLSPLSL